MEKIIAWVEIPTSDFTRALKFYNHVLKLEMKALDFGKEKMACFPGGEGAIYHSEDSTPASGGAIVSFLVPDNIESALSRSNELGGKILILKTKIEAEGKGYFANIIDSEGNRIGLYENL